MNFRPLRSPGAWLIAIGTALVAVVGVASIDASPDGDTIPRELVQIPLQTAPALIAQASPTVLMSTEVVRAGETIYSLLSRNGVIDPDAVKLIRTHHSLAAVRQAVPGGQLTLGRDDEGTLQSLEYVAPDFRRVVIARTDDGLQIDMNRIQPDTRVAVRAGEVGRSFFASLRSAGVPDEVQRQLVNVFSKQFDLHKAAQEIERFAVAYEELMVDGTVVRLGRVLATELVRDGRTYRAVWFGGTKGGKYFTPEGASLDRMFLPSPVEFTQVTSWFGEFRQLRWNAGLPHRGIDYAAPIGTPVKASGDGVIEFIGEQRGYGNVIVLKHREPYTTLYAHLDAFAEGLAPGQRVLQGEVIGTVGRTGWATGPHLHYEFRVNGEAQDPATDSLPADELAAAETLARFRQHAATFTYLLDHTRGVRTASAN